MGQADRQLKRPPLTPTSALRLGVLGAALLSLAFSAACSTEQDFGPTGLQPDGMYIIVGTEFAFVPDMLEIPVNQEAVIVFKNRGTVDHDLVIEEFDVSTGTIRIGREKTVRFTPTGTGEFAVTCSIPGHGDAGMTGTIAVVQQTAPDSTQG